MIYFLDMNPIALQIGPISIYWYGICYLFGFILGYLFLLTQTDKLTQPWSSVMLADLVFYVACGVIFGGTIGYVLFYQPELIFQDPLRLFQFWERGRAFHGGMLGVFLAVWLFGRLKKIAFFELTDFIAPAAAIGIGFGRIGNFMNGELWGKQTTVPWGIIFPWAGPVPRHPSQLYEFFLEGLVLFLLLWGLSRSTSKVGYVSAGFMILYGCFRFSVEFFREPDFDQGYLFWGWVTKGQLLSVPMVFVGLFLIWFFHRKYTNETVS